MRQHSLRMSPIAIAIAASSLGTLGSLPIATLAQAQDSLIEEVVVTARKREESLQNVPVAVTALSPSQI
jgi:iron complex outermembrane receptor protein